ncbi:chitin binding peritrophin-A domain-containing protein [Sphingobacterium sp.]|uniref:chitin binding peritrophin-A domain-containing protein n=1 Tax=Sphingobacterium sp. TaxID=341027 RepID=UPI0031CEA87E
MKRKQKVYCLLLACILALAASCQKELSLRSEMPENELVKKAQAFITLQKNANSNMDFKSLDFDWKRRSIAKNKQGNDVLFIPIANRMKSGKEYLEFTYLIDYKGQEITSFKQFLGSFNNETLQLTVLALDGSQITSGTYDNDKGMFRPEIKPDIIKKRSSTKANFTERELVTTQRLACPANLYFNPALKSCDQRANIEDDWASQYYMLYTYSDGSYELGPDSRELEEVEVPPPTNPNNPGGDGNTTPPGGSGGGGGTPVTPGGGSSGTNPTPDPMAIKKTPCDAMALANRINSDLRVKRIVDSIKNKGKEFGAYISFADPENANSIKFGTIYEGQHSKITINPRWNANEGYHLGFIHNHPEGNAPSPSDIFAILHNLEQMKQDVSASQLTNYINNFNSIVVSGGNIYTISIKNARYAGYAKTGYNKEKIAARHKKLAERYATKQAGQSLTAEQIQEAGEYALLKLFGEEISITKQQIGVDNSNRNLSTSGFSIVKSNPCN